jgi:hypothetical protein
MADTIGIQLNDTDTAQPEIFFLSNGLLIILILEKKKVN